MLKGLMTRLVLITTLLFLGLAGPASAKLTVGIGEQNADMFTDKRWQALKAPDVRYVLPWDAFVRDDWELAVFENYMNWARQAKARVLISFGHSSRQGRELRAPTRLQFIREFRKVRRRYPEVKLFQTWNEANHGTQPVWKKPGLAANYYNAMRRTCPECTITAPSVLDAPNMTWYIQRFKRKARYRVKVWALHNHIDANRHRTSGTREMLRVTRRGQLWFTETGGIVQPLGRRSPSPGVQPEERGAGDPQRVQPRQAQPQADHADLPVPLDGPGRASPALGLGPGGPAWEDTPVAADVPGAAAPDSMSQSAAASSAVVAQ